MCAVFQVISAKSMTTWGRTYYNNIMTFIVFLPLAFVMGEDKTMSGYLADGKLTIDAILLLLASCIWGTAISFLGFRSFPNAQSQHPPFSEETSVHTYICWIGG